MIRPGHYYSLTVWATREIQRQPGRNILLFAGLLSLVFLVATALFFSQALDATWRQQLDNAPDLIIRRINGGGWAPIPAEEAVRCASRVPGVIDPTPRLWGVATGPDGPVTVVASPDVVADEMIKFLNPPSPGQAVVGQAVAGGATDTVFELTAVNSLRLKVAGTFPPPTLLATHDVVWTTAPDARHLLGLLPHQASDLSVHLFRREEEQAIQADLAAAFPWPVSITDRSTSALRHHTVATRIGGMAVVVCIPALLALLLIITDVAVDSNNRRSHWGLLLSMGWTTRDLVHLQVIKALIIGIPALVCGLASAYAAVFYPPAAGVTAFLISGGERLPMVILNRGGVVITMLEIAAMIGLPYLAAVFLACVHSVANDPWDLLQADSWS